MTTIGLDALTPVLGAVLAPAIPAPGRAIVLLVEEVVVLQPGGGGPRLIDGRYSVVQIATCALGWAPSGSATTTNQESPLRPAGNHRHDLWFGLREGVWGADRERTQRAEPSQRVG